MNLLQRISVAIAVLAGRLSDVIVFRHPIQRGQWPPLVTFDTDDVVRCGANVVILAPWVTEKTSGISPLPIAQKEGQTVIILRGRL